MVVRNVVLFMEIAPYDSAPCVAHSPGRPKTPRAQRTTGPFDAVRVTGRPIDEDTQYGIRQFSATKSISLDKVSH